jgi:chromosomal replication initiation ATPase DnaA
MIDRPYLDFGTHAKPIVAAQLRRKVDDVDADELPPIPDRDSAPLDVLRVVAAAYKVTLDQLQGTDRHKNIAEARIVAYWLVRTRTALSFPELGRVMRKDHTTVMYGVGRCELRRKTDARFQDFTDRLAAAVDARVKGEAA